MPDNYVLSNPDGASAINLGSWLEADPGPDFDFGSLFKSQFVEHPGVEGGALTYRSSGLRKFKFPLVLASTGAFTGGLNGLTSMIRQMAQAGAYIDLQPQGIASTEAIRFDIADGRLDENYHVHINRYARRRASLELSVQPFGYWPTMITLASVASIGDYGTLQIPSGAVLGDVLGLADLAIAPVAGATTYAAGSWPPDFIAWSLAPRASFLPFWGGGSLTQQSTLTASLLGDAFAPASQAQLVYPSPGGGVDAYCVTMLHANGTDTSTTFTDSSTAAHTWTASGNAQLDTAQFKFTTASMLFDGTGDYISTADSSDFDLGSDDWTIDCWVRFSVLGANRRCLYSQNSAASDDRALYLRYNSGLQIAISTDGSSFLLNYTATWAPVINTWYHVACVRSGNSIKLFVDGAQVGTTQTFSGSVFNSSASPRVGAYAVTGDESYMSGWIDEFRFSKGIARWTSGFTPPTVEYSTGNPQDGWAEMAYLTIPAAVEPAYRGRFRIYAYAKTAPSHADPWLLAVDALPKTYAWASSGVVASVAPGVATGTPGIHGAQASPAYQIVDLGELAIPAVASGISQDVTLRFWQKPPGVASSMNIGLGGVYLMALDGANGVLPRGINLPSISTPSLGRFYLNAIDRRALIAGPTGGAASPLPVDDAYRFYRGQQPKVTPSTQALQVLLGSRKVASGATAPVVRAAPAYTAVTIRYRPRFVFLDNV